MEIEKLSQFKKWRKVGKELRTIINVYHPERVGVIRTITKVQSNAIYLDDKRLNDEKSTSYIFKDNAMNIIEDLSTSSEIGFTNSNNEVRDIVINRINERKKTLISNGTQFIDEYRFIKLSYEFIF